MKKSYKSVNNWIWYKNLRTFYKNKKFAKIVGIHPAGNHQKKHRNKVRKSPKLAIETPNDLYNVVLVSSLLALRIYFPACSSDSVVDFDRLLSTRKMFYIVLIDSSWGLMFSFRFDRDFYKVLDFNVIPLPYCKISTALF